MQGKVKFRSFNKKEYYNPLLDASLIGKKIGNIVVLPYYFCKEDRAYWLCKCVCGKEVVKSRDNLLYASKFLSCGCIKYITKSLKGTENPSFKNLSGKIIEHPFGKIKILKFTKFYKGNSYWQFKCHCGKISEAIGTRLCSKKHKSCGCLKGLSRLKNIKGKTFGILKVIERIVINNNLKVWKCICLKCKNILYKDSYSITSVKAKCCRKCFGKFFNKENHPMWDKNITPQERILAKNRFYNPKHREWRLKIFARDNYTCQITGKTGKICAHHIESWHSNKKARYKISNGITILQ